MSRQLGGYGYPSDEPAATARANGGGPRGGPCGGPRGGGGRGSSGDGPDYRDGRTKRPQVYEYTYTSEEHYTSYSGAVPPPSTTIDPSLQPTPPSSSGPGVRRKKMFGYLKAANELRQNYSAQLMQKLNGETANDASSSKDSPSNFTDPYFAAQGDEQMVLFPTYAKRHIKRKPRDSPSLQRYVDQASDEYDQQAQRELARWRAEWERYDNDKAVVDVDVRGWLFAPQRGQLNRKSRIMVGLAKRLSGIPSQPVRSAWDEGEVLFNADGSPHDVTIQDNDAGRRSSSASSGGRAAGQQRPRPSKSGECLYSTQDEIDKANAELMERLNPLLTIPLVEVPITIFFYNSSQSQSRTVITNDGGHFYIRVSLDFIPTQVRVLALEDLSQTETVNLLEEDGVSLISDIDDTIKHTAITMGAKEIFRNTFVRKPETLTIDGVNEWYQDLARRGVKMHYVSNSPWQLYPQIELYFVLAGLPSGSFHLKRYAGLQEFFEPTVEKKRGALEMILRDFPARKFILVGDSGESDLEAYTELVLAHPGRILGIFIRDITTPLRQPQQSWARTRERSDSDLLPQRNRIYPVGYSDTDLTRDRPPIPPRTVRSQQQQPPSASPEPRIEEDLIDLSIDDDESPSQKAPPSIPPKTKPPIPKRKPLPPSLPAKPQSLRGAPSVPDLRKTSMPASMSTSDLRAGTQKTGIDSTTPGPSRNQYNTLEVPFPPPPRKSSSSNGSPRSDVQSPPPPLPPPRRRATDTASPEGEYRPQLPVRPPRHPATTLPPPPQRQWNSPQSQGQYQGGAGSGMPMQSTGQIPTKQEEAWQRRWDRAQDILRKQNVMLVSWRVGKDVHEMCIKLVEREMRDAARRGGRETK